MKIGKIGIQNYGLILYQPSQFSPLIVAFYRS